MPAGAFTFQPARYDVTPEAAGTAWFEPRLQVVVPRGRMTLRRGDVSAEHRVMSFNDSVVVGVTTYPEPQQALRYVNSQCPIVHPNTH